MGYCCDRSMHSILPYIGNACIYGLRDTLEHLRHVSRPNNIECQTPAPLRWLQDPQVRLLYAYFHSFGVVNKILPFIK